MAAIVQRLERQIVVLDVVGSIPTSRPIAPLPSPVKIIALTDPEIYNSGNILVPSAPHDTL